MTHATAPLVAPPVLDLLYPLTEFEPRDRPLPLEREEVGARRMPEPYRSLLVHTSDMTSKLEAFHGEPIVLRLLARRRTEDALLRKVVLLGERSGRALEFGAIRIALDAFEAEPRRLILESHLPLGTILARCGVAYESRPRLYFRVTSDERIEGQLGVAPGVVLYGRQNVLAGPDGRTLAEVVEILPPHAV